MTVSSQPLFAQSLFDLARTVLGCPLPGQKLALMQQLGERLTSPVAIDAAEWVAFACAPASARDHARGAPERPPVVAPEQVPRRRPSTPEGRAALLHAVAHIEYCAIDLALDHALRFAGMPADYYRDWLGVALDEALHFDLLRVRLRAMGHDYGDFPVHDGLWQMARKTAHDLLARMAMVPRLLEARGLDATPPIQAKLRAVGDHAAVAVLDVIAHDEVRHVRLGDFWFRTLCAERGLDVEASFRALIIEYAGPWPQTPLNTTARLAAGFTADELERLTCDRPGR